MNKQALIYTIELAKQAGELATQFLKKPHDLEYEKTFVGLIEKKIKNQNIFNFGVGSYSPSVYLYKLKKKNLLKQEKKDYVHIDMSTILPADSIAINKEFESHNIKMFDAPVARLVNNAIDGTLLILVGGDKDKFEEIKPLLETMGSDVVYCGISGSGSKMKIINNYMSIVSNIVTAETLSLVEKSGIDLNLAINLLTTTAAGKGHLNVSYPIKVLKNDISPGFKNTLALKDLRLALEQAAIDGVDLITGKAALKSYEDAEKTNYKDLDWTSMFNFIKEKNK